jgi:hypothetical protein
MVHYLFSWIKEKWRSKTGKAGTVATAYGLFRGVWDAFLWIVDAPGRWHQVGDWIKKMPSLPLHLPSWLTPAVFVTGIVLLLWDGWKSRRPANLHIKMLAAFWDERRILNTPNQRIHVCVYVGVGNTREKDFQIKKAALVLEVGGKEFSGNSDEAICNFGSICHFTDFRWKGDKETNHGIYTPIISLFSLIHSGRPLRNEAWEEGAIMFTFQGGQMPPFVTDDMSPSNSRLLLIDSLDKTQEFNLGPISIPYGQFLNAA